MQPTKNNRSASTNPIFARAKAKVGSQGNIQIGLSQYKLTAPLPEIVVTAPLFAQNSIYRRIIFPNAFPKDYTLIGTKGLRTNGDLKRELLWSVSVLLPFFSEINKFSKLKTRAEKEILYGSYESLEISLNEIERDFGVSTWLAETRINLSQIKDGYTAQRDLSNSLLQASEKYPIINFIFSWFAFRAEENVSAVEFHKFLDRYIPVRVGQDFLIHAILGNCPAADIPQLAMAIAYTDIFPIIDRYLYLIRLLQAFLSNDKDQEIYAFIRDTIKPLVNCIDDVALHRLFFAYGGHPRTKINTNDRLTILDAYASGEYEKLENITKLKIQSAFSIDTLYMYLRSQAQNQNDAPPLAVSPGSVFARIEQDLKKLTSFSNDASEAAARLSKISLVHFGTFWAASLALIVQRQYHDERVFLANSLQVFNALRVDEEDPILAFSFERLSIGRRYLETYFPGENDRLSVLFVNTLLDSSETADGVFAKFPKNRNRKMQAMACMRTKKFREAVRILSEVFLSSDVPIVKYEAGLLLAEALHREGELLECARVCADMYVGASYLGKILPIEKLTNDVIETDSVSSDTANSLLGDLAIVIVLDAYSRVISPNRDPERADSFNDFLRANRLRFASDINAVDIRFPPLQLMHFWQFVCVPEVLDQSLALTSTRAVEDERAKILVLTTELMQSQGVSPPPQLMEELREIRTRQAVRDTTLQLDQSKIYVNVEGIKRSIAVSMKESWLRYRLISAQRDRSAFEEKLEAIQEVLNLSGITILPMNMPATERNKLFSRMVLELRDLFTTSKEFGLDANLSTNIRHGYVMRELRKPFITQNLVTNKATEYGGYLPNEYWLSRSDEMESADHDTLLGALGHFSGRVDEEIEFLNRRLLRIQSDQVPEGLFNFIISDIEAVVIQKQCANLEDYQEFIDVVLNFLWQRTDASLELVRNALRDVTLAKLSSYMLDLENTLQTIQQYRTAVDIQSALNLAKPELQSAVERVASWFKLSDSQEYPDYAFTTSYAAALATVESYYSNLDMQSNLNCENSLQMAGRTLPHFVRLFSLLLENAAFHSGINKGRLDVIASAGVQDHMLSIAIKNRLAAHIDRVTLQKKIDRINSEFDGEFKSEAVRQEGGSGYPKIQKLLRHDLGRMCILHIYLENDEFFCVDMLMNSAGVVL
ncbi:hypothetical protein AB4037_11755 [Labrys sp. KB_33_2]|uniref:hypothetical protein n=1 Tax=Labrys sp. KB_33_2 TaxID=3237479 RepID=UPI003F8E1A33